MPANPRGMSKLLATAALLVAAMLLPTGPATAASITVTTSADEYNTGAGCSLREASVAANTDASFGGCPAGSGADTVSVPAGVYVLDGPTPTHEDASADGDIDFTDLDGVTVRGVGLRSTIIDGNSRDVGERVFHVLDGDATFEDLTVRNGEEEQTCGPGGGIYAEGDGNTVSILRSSVHDNTTCSNGGGVASGDVEVPTTLVITDSEIANNHADGSDSDGGGIHSDGGPVVVTGSVVEDNFASDFGGGIKSFGDLTIQASTITGNSISVGSGGGVWGGEGALLDIDDTTIDGNSTTGDGGGVYIACCNSEASITRATISNNVAGDGGGIYNDNSAVSRLLRGVAATQPGVTSLENVTVSSNYADGNGGGIFNFGTGSELDLNHVTVYRNASGDGTAGGVQDSSNLTLSYRNTIIAGNTPSDCNGSESSSGYNVLGDTSCDDDGSTDQSNTDPRLAPLRDNGGPTQTHELLQGSPAIDAAEGGATCPATDQRGLGRPTGARCDIGAYEVGDVVLGADLARLRCRGKDPTIVGTSGPDTIRGTPGRDVIQGLEGADRLRGRGGNDLICGARGNDLLKGGKGNDILKGHRGIDTYRGGGGEDLCIPGPEDDVYKGCEAPPQTTR